MLISTFCLTNLKDHVVSELTQLRNFIEKTLIKAKEIKQTS